MARDPRESLPLSAAEFEILVSLADREKHGYAILKDVDRRTAGRARLSAATLYAVIRRLVADGVLAESRQRPDPALDDERRRYFGITEYGRRVAAAEVARMEEAVKSARARRLVRRMRPA